MLSTAIPASSFLNSKSKRLTNYTADDVGIVVDVFRLAQAAGVSSAVWLIGRSANPGRIEVR